MHTGTYFSVSFDQQWRRMDCQTSSHTVDLGCFIGVTRAWHKPMVLVTKCYRALVPLNSHSDNGQCCCQCPSLRFNFAVPFLRLISIFKPLYCMPCPFLHFEKSSCASFGFYMHAALSESRQPAKLPPSNILFMLIWTNRIKVILDLQTVDF